MTDINDMSEKDITNYLIDKSSRVSEIRKNDLSDMSDIDIVINVDGWTTYYVPYGSVLFNNIYNYLTGIAVVNEQRYIKEKEDAERAEYERLKVKYE